jgi:hypothetical protein
MSREGFLFEAEMGTSGPNSFARQGSNRSFYMTDIESCVSWLWMACEDPW